ncbi:MAG: hypothetical protein HY710_15025, partial [Candidatus Latescibacteria bacterium]|nr:hypothetical protein [Candidatus Latescibacterota bacterium]
MHPPSWLTDWISRGRVFFEGDDLGTRPLKALSRRFLGAGLGVSVFLHLTIPGVILFLQTVGEGPAMTLRLTPYTPSLVDVIPTPSL